MVNKNSMEEVEHFIIETLLRILRSTECIPSRLVQLGNDLGILGETYTTKSVL